VFLSAVAPAPAAAATPGALPFQPIFGPIGAQPPSNLAATVTPQIRSAAKKAAELARKRRAVPKPPAPKPKPKPKPRVSYGPWHTAKASWYWEPQPLAGGGYLTPGAMIVAHKSLPFGTKIQFSYHGRTCVAVVKDRGPYVGGREFDLGPGTAKALHFDGVDYDSYRLVK
jgi:rare lipoprotein A (peptidoglycan hydrolase)